MAIKPALTQFNGGEISPQLEGRIDWDKYNYSAKLCKNFIPLVEGSLKRRGGTHFVYSAQTLKTYKLIFKITCDVTPTLTVNGNQINLTNSGNVYTSEIFYCMRGEEVAYNIEANGYLSLYETISIQQDTTLEKTLVQGETANAKILSFTQDIELELNNKKINLGDTVKVNVSSYTDNGLEIVYNRLLISYNGIYYDKAIWTLRGDLVKFLIVLWDNTDILIYTPSPPRNSLLEAPHDSVLPTIIPDNDLSIEHSLILPPAMYSVSLVGAGGYSFVTPEGETFVAGGGARINGELSIKDYDQNLIVVRGLTPSKEEISTLGGTTSISSITGEVLCSAGGGDSDYPTPNGKGGSYQVDETVFNGTAYNGWGNGKSGSSESGGDYEYGNGSTYALEHGLKSDGYLSIGFSMELEE